MTLLKEIINKDTQNEICYICDPKNVPLGNKKQDRIINFSEKMFLFLKQYEDIEDIIIACNTISSLINIFNDKFNITFFDIISPTCNYLKNNSIKDVGLIATDFTIKSKVYDNYCKNNNINLSTVSSQNLAFLIENNFNDTKKLKEEIRNNIEKLEIKKNIILGCTHYPIIIDLFNHIYKETNFINPSKIFSNNLKNSKNKSKVKIYTTKKTNILVQCLQKLHIEYQEIIEIKL